MQMHGDIRTEGTEFSCVLSMFAGLFTCIVFSLLFSFFAPSDLSGAKIENNKKHNKCIHVHFFPFSKKQYCISAVFRPVAYTVFWPYKALPGSRRRDFPIKLLKQDRCQML